MNRFLTKFNFAIANTAAVLAAMYAAFWFDLDRPYWSMFTVFIVAHPISGAVRSKGVYRLFGTFAGAAMALFLVPPLVQAPYLLSLAMSAWVGLCLTVALFDRTPRSYAFLLAGYTAAIVGFSVADTPLAIFDTAVARFEEVSLGIVCATVAHSVFFPQNVLQALQEQLDATLKTSADKIGEGLLLPADGADRAAQQRLATVLTDLHLLYTHVAYETSDVPRLRPVMRGLIDKLALLLPALTAARAAADALRKSGGIAVPVDGYMRVAAAWIGLPGGAARSAYPALAEQGAAVSRAIEHAAPAWRGLLEGAVVTNVGTLTQALADSRDLAAAIGDPSAALSPHLREAIQGSDRRPLHRDRGLALLSGFAAFAGTLIACVLWIELSWPEGAIAAQFAAISCSLFATLDNPARVLWSAMAGILVTLPLGAVYEFAILPQISDFEMLALVLSPVLMALSYMQTIPKLANAAFIVAIAFAGGLALQTTYRADFAVFLNLNIAEIVGGLIGIVTNMVFRTIDPVWNALRISRAGWNSVWQLAERGTPDLRGWITEMLDRFGLVRSRLATVTVEPSPHIDGLRDLRVGLDLGAVEAAQAAGGLAAQSALARVRAAVADVYDGWLRGAMVEDDHGAAAAIDDGIVAVSAQPASEERRRTLAALVGLRLDLAPGAPAFEGAAP